MSDIILQQFKNQLIGFLDELIIQYPSEGDFIVIRMFILNRMPIHVLMNTFNFELNKENNLFKTMIKNRDEKFFIENDLFNLNVGNQNKTSFFKRLWSSGSLKEHEKTNLWQWFDSFVYLTDKYTNLVETKK